VKTKIVIYSGETTHVGAYFNIRVHNFLTILPNWFY